MIKLKLIFVLLSAACVSACGGSNDVQANSPVPKDFHLVPATAATANVVSSAATEQGAALEVESHQKLANEIAIATPRDFPTDFSGYKQPTATAEAPITAGPSDSKNINARSANYGY